MMESKRLYFCSSCHDELDEEKPDNEWTDGMRSLFKTHCKECAAELADGSIVGGQHTFNHDTGGGRRVIRESKTH